MMIASVMLHSTRGLGRGFPPGPEDFPDWLNAQRLQGLGFDCSMNPAGTDAARFYERQRPRQAFVALENDGPAWRAWMKAYQE